MGFVLGNGAKATGQHSVKWESKNLLNLEYSNYLSVLNRNVRKIQECFDILRFFFDILIFEILQEFFEILRAECVRHLQI